MAQFERLQELWRRQSQPGIAAADVARLTRSLRAYRKRQTWIYAGKGLAVSAAVGWTLVAGHASPTVIAGVLLAAVSGGLLMFQEWRTHRAIAPQDFTAPSLGFVSDTIARITAQRDACRRYYWPLMAAMVVAMNLILAGGHAQLWMRALFSGLPFAACEFGMWIRRKRFDAECRPLISQLLELQAALEDRPE